ncbi:restriction endonuclease subunit S [Proteus mirabilis]|nr:restriction endonuclease subunit S [Proteus mirabilis]
MSEWQNTTLGDVITLHYGKALKTQNRIVGNIPVYSSAGITGYHNEPLVMSKGIIIGRKGTVGKVYYSPEPFWCIDTAYYVLPNETKYDFIWLYYQLGTIGLEELNEDSAVPGLNRTTAYSQDILIPSIAEQKAIASVLSSLDDKIDLLHRQNKTLESMAETLFRQWFVEEAQDDWERKPLTKIATFTNGLACQKYPPKKGELGLPVLKIKELNSGITDSSDVATKDVKPDYIVEHGDIIFAWSASLMVKIWSGERCVLNQHLFNVKSNKFPKWFIYEWCKYYLDEFISISQSHATTMGHIKRKDLDEAIALIPPKDELDAMDIEMSALFESKVHKLRQIQTLEKLRDTLLPKLMSGEVRVSYTPEEIKQ